MERAFQGPFPLAINNVMNEFDHYSDKSVLEGPDPEHNEKQYRQDAGGLVTADNGIADRLLKNDRLYRELKGDWVREGFNKSRNIKTFHQTTNDFTSRELNEKLEQCKY